MRKICSDVMLLSDNETFINTYKEIALSCEVNLHIESDWNEAYRIKEEVIICGSKYLNQINKAYYGSVVLILKEKENFTSFLKMGIESFVFDYQNVKELSFAFTKAEKKYIKTTVKDMSVVLTDSNSDEYVQGDYAFYFSRNSFYYKGKGIHLTKCYQLFLAEWLLNGNKDNNKRPYLCKMRKKFGKDFLSDIDRFGQIKGVKK